MPETVTAPVVTPDVTKAIGPVGQEITEKKASSVDIPVAGMDPPKKSEPEAAPVAAGGAGAAKEGEEAPKADPAESIRFKVSIGGEEKEFSATEMASFTDEKLSKAVEIHDNAVKALRRVADDPLGLALDAMTGKFGGDRQKAYAELIKLCDEAVANEYKFQSMPEAERKALEWEHRAKAIEAKLKERDDAEAAEKQRGVKAAAAERLIGEYRAAIKDAGLPDSAEAQYRIIELAKMERQKGNKTSLLEIAKYVKQEMKVREENFDFKNLDIEKLRKVRPDLIEALTKGSVEDIKKAREGGVATQHKPSDFSRSTGVLPRLTPTSRILAGM